MISEASKREKIANAVLGATFALSAAQSPKDFVRTGNIESPGVALMQTWGRKRGEAERNLDSGRVSHPARNKKMKKTLKEFLGEAHLYEMRKEDKVKGKEKTPMYIIPPKAPLVKTPEGNWVKLKRPNPDAMMGRMSQEMTPTPGDVQHSGRATRPLKTKRHEHGGGGSGARDGKPGEGRGVKRTQTIQDRRGRPDWQPGVDSRTPAKKVEDKRKKAAYLKSGGYNWKRYGG